MTNGLGIPIVPCCPASGGGDLMPWLLVVIFLLAGHTVLRAFRNRKGKPDMKNFKNLAIVAAVVVAVGLVFALKHNQAQSSESAPAPVAEVVPASVEATTAALPRLLELGADKCMACKLMAPIIEDLKTTYAGRLEVDFIDVWKDPDTAQLHGVRVIPMQIFFDAEGRELFRHEGFFAKEDILAKWKELGVDLSAEARP